MRPGKVLARQHQHVTGHASPRRMLIPPTWPYDAIRALALMFIALWVYSGPGVLPAFHPSPVFAAPPMARAEARFGGAVFTVDIADTPALQAQGLGGRRHLGPNDGMLFLYAMRARHSFWMKGMFIPIDMIWLDNNTVVHIEHRVPPPVPGTPPEALPTYQPGREANIVLEIAAGRAEALGLKIGDTISFRFNVP